MLDDKLTTRVDRNPEQLSLDFFALQQNNRPKASTRKPAVFNASFNNQIKVRYSQRAKRMSILVKQSGQVELIAPGKKYRRPSQKRIRDFAQSQAEWIKKTVNQYLRQKSQTDSIENLDEYNRPLSISLPFLNKRFTIEYSAVLNQKKKTLHEAENALTLADKYSDKEVAIKLGDWLSKTAKKHLLPMLNDLSIQLGLHYKKASIRGQKTRWGSCSSSGNISLNYCILFLEPQMARYVLVHELCHLQEFNHSRRFWRLVKQFEPGYKSIDKNINHIWESLPNWLDLRFDKKEPQTDYFYLSLD